MEAKIKGDKHQEVVAGSSCCSAGSCSKPSPEIPRDTCCGEQGSDEEQAPCNTELVKTEPAVTSGQLENCCEKDPAHGKKQKSCCDGRIVRINILPIMLMSIR